MYVRGSGSRTPKARSREYAARPDEPDDEGQHRQDQGVFHPAVVVPESLRQVDLDDGHGHRSDDARGREGRQEAGEDAQSAEELAQAADDGEKPGRPHAQALEEPGMSGDPPAAEPAEELLGAVGEEDPAEGDAQDRAVPRS